MDGHHILVVEDDTSISDMLRAYFVGHGYGVDVVERGEDALEHCTVHVPDLVLLDTTLPDIDGFAVCRKLRAATRTSLVPIVFLTEQRKLADRIVGLESGADDYVAKPFDLDELRLRVGAAIRAHQHFSMTDATTHMPSGRLLEEQLRNLLRTSGWSLLYIGVDHLAPFTGQYGFVAGEEALRLAAALIQEVVDGVGTLDDFVGRATNDVFVVITKSADASGMADQLRQRFGQGVQSLYRPEHRERGGIEQPDGSSAPLMGLSIGIVSDEGQTFYDILEITRAAAEARRRDQRDRRGPVQDA